MEASSVIHLFRGQDSKKRLETSIVVYELHSKEESLNAANFLPYSAQKQEQTQGSQATLNGVNFGLTENASNL